jgi:hypothetical protein
MPITINPSDAPRIREWLQKRGGIQVWESADLGDPVSSVFCPYLGEDGQIKNAPSWKHSRRGALITSESDVTVTTYRDVKTIRIALQRGYGYGFVLTDAASQKLRKALSQFPDSTYRFDGFDGKDAVIMVPDRQVPLSGWQ